MRLNHVGWARFLDDRNNQSRFLACFHRCGPLRGVRSDSRRDYYHLDFLLFAINMYLCYSAAIYHRRLG